MQDVQLDQTFSIEFSQNLDAATSAAVKLYDPHRAEAVDVTLQINGTTVTITPTGRLSPNAEYEVRVDSTLLVAQGTALESPVNIAFRTRDLSPTPAVSNAAQGLVGSMTTDLDDFQMAGNAAGDLIMAWRVDVKISVSHYRASTNQWTQESDVETGAESDKSIRVVIAENGIGCVGWVAGEFKTKCYSNAWEVGAPVQHSESPNAGKESLMVLLPNGDIRAVWFELDSNSDTDVWSKVWNSTSGWTPAEGVGQSVGSPAALDGRNLVANAAGKAVVAWNGGSNGGDVYGSYFNGATWILGSAVTPGSGIPATRLQVILDGAGDAVMVWEHNSNSINSFAYRTAPPGWLGIEENIAGATAVFPSLVSQGGRALVAFHDNAGVVNYITRGVGAYWEGTYSLVATTSVFNNGPLFAASNDLDDVFVFVRHNSGFDRPVGFGYHKDGTDVGWSTMTNWSPGEAGASYFLNVDGHGNAFFTSHNAPVAYFTRIKRGDGVFLDWTPQLTASRVVGQHVTRDGRVMLIEAVDGTGAELGTFRFELREFK